MKDTRALLAYFLREISKKAVSYEGLPAHVAIGKALEELRPEIEASMQSAGLSTEEVREMMKIFAES